MEEVVAKQKYEEAKKANLISEQTSMRKLNSSWIPRIKSKEEDESLQDS